MGICMICEDSNQNQVYNIEPLSQEQVNTILYEDNSSLGAIVIKKKKRPEGSRKEIHALTNKRGYRRNESQDEFTFMNKIIDENPEKISEKQSNSNMVQVSY